MIKFPSNSHKLFLKFSSFMVYEEPDTGSVEFSQFNPNNTFYWFCTVIPILHMSKYEHQMLLYRNILHLTLQQYYLLGNENIVVFQSVFLSSSGPT